MNWQQRSTYYLSCQQNERIGYREFSRRVLSQDDEERGSDSMWQNAVMGSAAPPHSLTMTQAQFRQHRRVPVSPLLLGTWRTSTSLSWISKTLSEMNSGKETSDTMHDSPTFLIIQPSAPGEVTRSSLQEPVGSSQLQSGTREHRQRQGWHFKHLTISISVAHGPWFLQYAHRSQLPQIYLVDLMQPTPKPGVSTWFQGGET